MNSRDCKIVGDVPPERLYGVWGIKSSIVFVNLANTRYPGKESSSLHG